MFLRLSDVAYGLPPYEEQVLLSGLDREPDHTGYNQRGAYFHVFDELRQALADALAKGSKRLLAAYLQTLLAYPDGCTRGETVFGSRTGDLIVQVPPLAEDKLYPRSSHWWTWWPPSGWPDARCWSMPPTPGRGTSRNGWKTS